MRGDNDGEEKIAAGKKKKGLPKYPSAEDLSGGGGGLPRKKERSVGKNDRDNGQILGDAFYAQKNRVKKDRGAAKKKKQRKPSDPKKEKTSHRNRPGKGNTGYWGGKKKACLSRGRAHGKGNRGDASK